MTLISTSALQKITAVVLAVAVASFASAEIHKRLLVPRQQEREPIPTEQTPENRIALILGTVSSIGNQSFILTTITDDLQVTFPPQTTFYTTSQPGCDIELNPGCGGTIVQSTKKEVLQEGVTVTVACEQSGPGSFVAERVNLVTSR